MNHQVDRSDIYTSKVEQEESAQVQEKQALSNWQALSKCQGWQINVTLRWVHWSFSRALHRSHYKLLNRVGQHELNKTCEWIVKLWNCHICIFISGNNFLRYLHEKLYSALFFIFFSTLINVPNEINNNVR